MQLLRFAKRYPPLWLLPLFGAVIYTLIVTKPTAKRWSKPQSAQISVEIQSIQSKDVAVDIKSYGIVRPRIQSQLVAQVGGKVEWVSEQLRDGGFFKKGERLLQLEKADYQVEVDIAFANLADAKSRLQEQQALAQQAKTDWERLKRSGNASPLVLREPQVAAAEANVKSAKARYEKAKLNLTRTTILAPFDGRVLQKNIDIGQVVSNNAMLASVYAIGAIEVSLPIKNDELALINAPEAYQDADSSKGEFPRVTLYSTLGGAEEWLGKIVRTAAAVSDQSRQLSVVAQIRDPFGQATRDKIPLKIGQYVTAKIQGKTLVDAIQIPNSAIYQGSYVYLYENGVVNRQTITIKWQDEETAIIESGLNNGDYLVLTTLGRVNSGTPVSIAGESTPDTPPSNKFKNDKKKDRDHSDKKGKQWPAKAQRAAPTIVGELS